MDEPLSVAALFSSADVLLTVCTIIPEMGSRRNTAARAAEYADSLWGSAAKGLDEAKAFLGDEVNAVYITRIASSPTEVHTAQLAPQTGAQAPLRVGAARVADPHVG